MLEKIPEPFASIRCLFQSNSENSGLLGLVQRLLESRVERSKATFLHLIFRAKRPSQFSRLCNDADVPLAKLEGQLTKKEYFHTSYILFAISSSCACSEGCVITNSKE